jgi:hypothetical protein
VTGWPIVALAGGVKVTVCEARVTGNSRLTGVAGRYRALPSWVAMITHRPPALGTTVAPETVHTRRFCEVNDTVRPVGEFDRLSCSVGDDDAVKTTGTPTVVPGTGSNEICWAARSSLGLTWIDPDAWAGA